MGSLFTIVVIIACIGLIHFLLVQNPKGGGLNAEFGSAIQLGGAKRTTDILEKGTWGLAIAIAVICLAMASGGNSRVVNPADEEFGTDVNSITTDQQSGAQPGQPAQPAMPVGIPPAQ